MALSTLVCKCTELQNHYITVISDRSRDLEVLVEFKYKFHKILLWVIIPLFIFGCCCPLCVWQLDTYGY